MNPLDRSSAPPSPQQDAEVNSPDQANSPLQVNIANIGAASASQPATVRPASSASQFIPVPSYPNVVEAPDGNIYHVLDSSEQQVISALLDQNLMLAGANAAQEINTHRALLNGIYIPAFKYELRMSYALSKDRLALQRFIQEVFKRLETLSCSYNRIQFISSLLLLADRQHLSLQTASELENIIETYIPNLGEKKYLQSNWNIDWPNSQFVRETQNLQKPNVDSITPEIKKRIYLKMEELDNAREQLLKGRFIRRIHYIDAAFAYGASPGVIKTWVRDGKKLCQGVTAGARPPRPVQPAPRAAEQQSRAFAEASLAPEQAAAFTSGIVIEDDQKPGPSRTAPRGGPLRFEPYQRAQPQAPSIDPSIQNQAQALGLTAETLQAFNLEAELDAEFNRQMEVLPWPRVTSEQFVQEQSSGRYVIMPATRMEIGRFIVENCPADARAYRFAALRYGVNVGDIANWVSEASD